MVDIGMEWELIGFTYNGMVYVSISSAKIEPYINTFNIVQPSQLLLQLGGITLQNIPSPNYIV